MLDGTMILTMINVVVVTINTVVNAIVSTTTYYPVVEKLTTGNCMWSLKIFSDHMLTFSNHISCQDQRPLKWVPKMIIHQGLLSWTHPLTGHPGTPPIRCTRASLIQDQFKRENTSQPCLSYITVQSIKVYKFWFTHLVHNTIIQSTSKSNGSLST
jgi:hypothetical protein